MPDAPEPAAIAARLPCAAQGQPVPEGAPLDDPALYFNRELSWIDFNWRVLFQALDPRVPLLERAGFVAITSSNLDEFFQKRVGGLKRQVVAGVQRLSADGRTPGEQLALIRAAVVSMRRAMGRAWEAVLKPALHARADVVVADWAELSEPQRAALCRHFHEHVYPVLTPLAVDPAHPFPFISDLSLSLAILLRQPGESGQHFARVKIPTQQLGRWVPVPGSAHAHHFLPLDELIRHNLDELFPGMEIDSAHVFRITRNADVTRSTDEAEDLLEVISEELRERRFAPVVRIELEREMPAQARALLLRELELVEDDLYEVDGLIGLGDCAALARLELPAFRFAPWEPAVPAVLAHHAGRAEEDDSLFAVLREQDVLVHHPYDSFSASTLRLIEEAAADPHVVAIKQTIYRTGEESPVVEALLRAAEAGKQVAVLVELQARFDEAANIEWAERLEDAGVHVAYGFVGLKTHAKVALVVRYEQGRPVLYGHIGTGNYHARTARLYADLGLLTCHPAIGTDLVRLFHHLTGHAPDQDYHHLIVAPREMRRDLLARIRREVEHQRAAGNGRILAKMNALDDVEVIQELYRASRAGVPIDLVVRGHTRLRPGLPGYSETIRVVSIVGRFLEHDRVFLFGNGGEPEVLIGSADWRQRNLDERVEAAVPILDPRLKERLIHTLHAALEDNSSAWELRPDGRYVLRQPRAGEPERQYHRRLMCEALARAGRG